MCCTTPGIDAIGCGSARPSRTNSGSTSWLGVTARLGDHPAQGRRGAQAARPDHGARDPGDVGRLLAHRSYLAPALRRDAGLRSDGLATG